MRSRAVTLTALSVLCATLVAAPAGAATPQERCDAFRLTASGKRILAKLRCHAKAKLQQTTVDAACLDRAEKLYVKHLAKGGADCLDPDSIISEGAEADVQMSTIVESVNGAAATLPDLSGTWQTHTLLRVDPSGGFSLECQYYPPGQCPRGDLLAIVDCVTDVVQSGTSMTQTSQCASAPDSPVTIGNFPQTASGTVNVSTGEWQLAGTVQPPGFPSYAYASEGVYAPDGETMTGFSTAGFSAGQSLWLATTTGHRAD
jgi:hypothetical protein